MTYLEYRGEAFFGKIALELFEDLKMRIPFKEQTCCEKIEKVGQFKMIGNERDDFSYWIGKIKECPRCRRVELEDIEKV